MDFFIVIHAELYYMKNSDDLTYTTMILRSPYITMGHKYL